MDGPAGVKSVAGTGREQPASRAGIPGVAPACDAQCDALSPDRVELLARAVILVAGMEIPEAVRAAVLARVLADLAHQSTRQPEGQGPGVYASSRMTSRYARQTRE